MKTVAFKTEADQRRCRENIRSMGMTITGWARKNGLSRHTVVNVLCREYGRSDNLGLVGQQIVGKLEEEGLI